MAEYISKEVAIEKTEAFCDVFVTKWTDEKVLAWIRNLPAADVVEVKRGRWVKDCDGDEYCEHCSRYMPVREVTGDPSATNFCPNCGADMREADHDRNHV